MSTGLAIRTAVRVADVLGNGMAYWGVTSEVAGRTANGGGWGN